MIRHLAPLPRRPGGGAWPSRPGTSWSPSELGAKLLFLGRPPKVGTSDRVTLAGAGLDRVVGQANDGGTAPAMTTPSSGTTGSLLLDTTVTLNGYVAIRTGDTANLSAASGGVSGVGATFHLICVAQVVAQPDSSHQDATWMLLGPPGSDGSHKNAGIGAVNALNGPWLYAGGQQNSTAQGSTVNPGARVDDQVRIFECVSNGTTIALYLDGGLVAETTATITISTDVFGYRGTYPLSIYGAPDVRIWLSMWMQLLSASERKSALQYAVTEVAGQRAMFIACTGDSITQGHVATANTTSFPELIKSRWAVPAGPRPARTVYILNAGISSQTSAQIATRSPSTFARAFAPLGTGIRPEWFVINGGKNDDRSTVTPAQCYANLAAMSVAGQALGVKTIILTIFYGTPEAMAPSDYTWVDAVNALIVANSCGADKIANAQADSLLGAPTVTHMPDNIHWDDVGNSEIADFIIATIGAA